jgi:hypothetical protein
MVNCLNSGYYGSPSGLSLVINSSMTINCKGLVATINALVIDAAGTDKIVLEGLYFDGNGTSASGIDIGRVGFVYIIDSTIRNYTDAGVFFNGTTQNARLFIQNSTISGNGNSGVKVVPPSAITTNILSVVGSMIDSNGPTAIKLDGPLAILGLQNSILNGSPAAISLSNGAQAYTVGKTNSVNGTFTFTGTIPLN